MKHLLISFCCLLGTLGAMAQEEKNVVYDANVEVRKAADFREIEVSGAIDLYISQGSEEAVAVSASADEVRDRIRTEVRNGVLHIFFDTKGWNWRSWSNSKMKAYVTFKDLRKVEATGACNVKTTGSIKLADLRIELSGASDFTGAIQADRLVIDASGASNAKISGTAVKAEIDASGACSIRAFDLKVDYCKVEASGASGIRIHVNKELSAEASGGSNIYYRGEGLIRDINTSGAASVKRRNDD